MSLLKYNDINVGINSQYILCESATVSQSSPQKPIYSFNSNVPFDNVPTTLKNSISLSYFMEPNNEPNFSIITGLLYDTTNPLSSIINVGNIFSSGYINNYSLQLNPNGLIKSNCSFDIFTPLTGNITAQNIADSGLYNSLNSSGIGHYWSAHFISGSNIVDDNKILQMGYSVSIGVTPIYGIGDPYPKQIYINNITENIEILTELQLNASYTGQIFDINRPDLQFLRLSGIASSNSISIGLTGFVMQDSKYEILNDNVIFFNNTYSRSK